MVHIRVNSLQRGNSRTGREPLSDLLGASSTYLAVSQAESGQLVALPLDAHNAKRCFLGQVIPADAAHPRTNTSGGIIQTDVVNRSQLWSKISNGELWGNWAAYLTLVSAVLTLSMSAKCWAPSDPNPFKATLKPMAIWRYWVQFGVIWR